MPSKLPDEVVEQVRAVWARHHDWTGIGIWEEVKKLNGGRELVGERKVQQIIRDAKKGRSGTPFKPFQQDEWKPWKNYNSETSAFLLRIDAVCQAVHSRRLYRHEAIWGARLRVALQGLFPYDQFCFVSLYAGREPIAFHLNQEIYTEDLDIVLAYKPWIPENLPAFIMVAVARPANVGHWKRPGTLIHGVVPWITWEGIVFDLSDPFSWQFQPFRYEPRTSQEIKERQAADVVLRFWMGPDPVCPPPYGHGDLGLPDLTETPGTPVTQIVINMNHGDHITQEILYLKKPNTAEEEER